MTSTPERDGATLAVLLALGQVGLVVAGGHTSVVAALPALLAVGLALAPVMPRAVRARPLALYALTLPIGALALDIAIISLSAIGIPLYPGVIAAVVLLFALAGLRAAPRVTPVAPEPDDHAWPALAVLAIALVLAAVLAERATGGAPPTGNDWGKYLLYADQIREHHGLLIHNPYWLLGVPFREDPGAPALYGGLLLLSGGAVGPLAHGIVAMVLLTILSLFGCAVVLFGARAAAAGALVFAAMPANPDMAAWHGLANFWALALVPIVLLGAGLLLRGDHDRRTLALTAAGLVGVAAAHRLTLLIVAIAGGLLVFGALVRRPRPTLAVLVRLGLWAAAIGVLVAVDLLRRSSGSGGVQSYQAYLDTKIAWRIVTRDLTWPLIAIGFAGLVAALAAVRRRLDPAAAVGAALALSAVAYGYSWVLHFPGFYIRSVYFLPLALALVVAAGFAAARPRGEALAATVAALLLAVTASLATGTQLVRETHQYYAWTDAASLKGWDTLAGLDRPGQVVVTDRCTSFMSTWLLQRPVIAALAPSDVGPAAELERVNQANAILTAKPGWQAIARRLNARYVTLNPTCPGTDALVPPTGVPVFVSRHLVVLRI